MFAVSLLLDSCLCDCPVIWSGKPSVDEVTLAFARNPYMDYSGEERDLLSI